MKLFHILLACGLLLPLGCAPLRAAEAEPELVVQAQSPEGEFDYDLRTGVATAEKGVVVRYGTVRLTAQRVIICQDKGQVLAEGQVRLERDGQTWVGDSITYDYKNKLIDADLFRSAHGPFFAAGTVVHTDQSNNTYKATDAYVTTDDYADSTQRVKAKSVTIVPGKYIEARNATLYVGSVPVMYLPYYRRTMGRHPNNWAFTPGYRNRFGPYMLSTYNWYGNETIDGAVHMDYRVKRGGAGGPDFNLHLGPYGEGKFMYYYAHDNEAGTNEVGNLIPSDRHRLWYLHKLDLTNELTFKAAMRYQSDELFMHDFFEPEYRRNVQPSSFVEGNKQWRNWSLDALAQPQLVNDFETVERLPDLKLTGYRQQLGESPFFYDSESSFGWFRHQYGQNPLPMYSAWRGDTYHQIVLPQTYFGWLNVTPRIGGRFTQYSEADGAGTTTRAQSRAVFNTGVEFSTKASRVWPGVQNRLLAVDGIRHIIEPGVNYAFVPRPTSRPPELPQFDSALDSYRLLPLDFPDYNAIDSIDSENVVRLSVRNRFQTKRKTGIENLLYWALYTDWRLDPRAGQGRFSDVYSDVDFLPRSWIQLSQDTRVDPNIGVLKELNSRLTILPGDKWTLTLGNRWLKQDPAYVAGSQQNLYYTSLFYRLNENWAVRTSHHFEAQTGNMQEQYYTVYRDLRSWTAALTLRLRDERNRPNDFTIAFTISLKAFPRYKLGQDSDQPGMLFGS
jgi:lipopolysaccharide assembly outer membrane protein LptD (OstA)